MHRAGFSDVLYTTITCITSVDSKDLPLLSADLDRHSDYMTRGRSPLWWRRSLRWWGSGPHERPQAMRHGHAERSPGMRLGLRSRPEPRAPWAGVMCDGKQRSLRRVRQPAPYGGWRCRYHEQHRAYVTCSLAATRSAAAGPDGSGSADGRPLQCRRPRREAARLCSGRRSTQSGAGARGLAREKRNDASLYPFRR